MNSQLVEPVPELGVLNSLYFERIDAYKDSDLAEQIDAEIALFVRQAWRRPRSEIKR